MGPQLGNMQCDTTAGRGEAQAAHGPSGIGFTAAMGNGSPMVQAPNGNGAPTGEWARGSRNRLQFGDARIWDVTETLRWRNTLALARRTGTR